MSYQLHDPPRRPGDRSTASLRSRPCPPRSSWPPGMEPGCARGLPKVLHPVCGRPMLEWVDRAAREARARIASSASSRPGERRGRGAAATASSVAEQREGEGTGAAVLAARDASSGATVVILSGDHPLHRARAVERLVAAHASDGAAATLLTTEELDPTAYGRIVRDARRHGRADRRDEEHRRRRPRELAIREINIGTYAFDADALFDALDKVAAEEHGERYLTGVFPLFRATGRPSPRTAPTTSRSARASTTAPT